MPIDTRIDHTKRCIYTTCRGKVTVDELYDYFSQLWGSSAFYGYNELFNSQQGDLNSIDFTSLHEIAHRLATVTTIDPNTRFAFVVADEKQLEKANYYRTTRKLASERMRDMESFYEVKQAESWLEQG